MLWGVMGAVPPQQVSRPEPAPSPALTLLERPMPKDQKPEFCRCGNEFLPDVQFCPQCGDMRLTRLAKKCYCGNAFGPGEIFCGMCGAPAEAMVLLGQLKRKTQERYRWHRRDSPNSFEAWNVDAKLESEFAYMHTLLCNPRFVELVWQEFRAFDFNADNRLDREEVINAVPEMVLKHGWKTQEQLDKIDHAELAKEFFQKMDQDSNDNVSAAEFLVYTAYFHYDCYHHKVDSPDIFFLDAAPKKAVCCNFCKLW